MFQVFSTDKDFIHRMQGFDNQVVLRETIENIDPDMVVVTDIESVETVLGYKDDLMIMVLSDTPSFIEGTALLQKGIKGYANTYIHLLHLTQAVDVIKSGNVWLYPSFIQELISQSTKHQAERTQLLQQLTLREQEIALLIAEGKSNKEIAIELEITERTVKAHLTSIYTKTGLQDRLSLAKTIYL